MRKVRGVGGLVFSLVFLGLVVFGLIERQPIYDWLRLNGYQPSAKVAQLALDTTMNDNGRKIFYVQHPEIDDKVEFNDRCREDEHTIVLGCYMNRRGIFLLDVTDTRLNGVEQVTSAHEMLHAAYDRLSSKERTRINALINQAYSTITDTRIKATVELYKKSGADVTNELHSILGTEVRTLTPELETYYRQYFSNRAAIVGFSENYEKVFTDRKATIDQYDAQLTSLKSQIDANQKDLAQKSAALAAKRSSMDGLLIAKNYQEYNAQVPVYNALANAYNSEANNTKKLIDQFNGILDSRNAIALEERTLFQAIDSPSYYSRY